MKDLFAIHELFAMNRSNLLASLCFELLAELPHIRISREPMHLAIVTPIHLLQSKRTLLLHFLKTLVYILY